MQHWEFKDYRASDGKNFVKIWNDGQDSAVRYQFLTVLNLLSATRKWDDLEEIEELAREHPGLWEVRFKVAGVNYRPAGFILKEPEFWPTRGTFVLLIGCHKKGRIYEPMNFDDAARLKAEFESGKGELVPHDYT